MDQLKNLQAWEALVQVFDHGSLSEAAQVMKVDVSTVSRLIAGLEKGLGRSLLVRNCRPVVLTEEAEDLIRSIRPIMKAYTAFALKLKNDSQSMNGVIRLSVAGGLMHTMLMPMLIDFKTLYPGISFSVKSAQPLSACFSGEIDIASVSGEPQGSEYIKLKRGRSIFIPVASPEYIRRHGIPLKPEDLVHHKGLVYAGPVRKLTTQLERNGEKRQLFWQSRIESSSILMVKEAVLNGSAIAVDLPLLHCFNELRTGQLVAILDGWHRPPIPAYAVCSKSSWHIRRIRLFMQWYCEKFERIFLHTEEVAREVLGEHCQHYFGEDVQIAPTQSD